MTALTIRLFGYPQFLVDDIPAKFERKKTLALAAYLAVETTPGSSGFARGTLTTLLWPEVPPEQAGAYLRQALWDFAKSAGEEWIVRDSASIGLNPQAEIQVDVLHFESLLARWKTGMQEDRAALAALNELTGLYQADFLSGFSLRDSPTFDDWQALTSETLRTHLLQALEALVHLHCRDGEYAAADPPARRWLALDPLNETAHRAAMLLYAQSGQRMTALRQYETCQKLLRAELELEPELETTLLYQRIRDGVITPELSSQSPETSRPTGTVTFLFTDIEGSTHLWESHPAAMRRAHARHEAILRQAMAAHGGYVYKMIGDAFQAAFSTPAAALQAALAAQRALHAELWGETGELKVRMALHSGVTEERGDDYVGPTLNRAARLLNAGHGGQVLLNQTSYELLREHLPEDISLLDLGEHSLKDLLNPEHIYQLVAPGLPLDFPPLVTSDRPILHLPPQTTPFIGRQAELAQILSLLENPDCRLVSLAGIGGSGKTRLAIQAAGQATSFPHGVYFVDLATASTLAEMVYRIASALELVFYTPPDASFSLQNAQAQLVSFLTAKSALLLLDNFEQLTTQADFLSELLAAAPRVKLIVTTRQRLDLPGEWFLPVSGLAYPGAQESELAPQFAAVQLFVKSAGRNIPFQPAPADWPAIARICQLVEGIPLAVEMAAAWVKMLSCPEIAAEIERDLDFLASSWRGMPQRHRTLRAVFDLSWDLLSDQECQAFARLSVFQGTFTRQAALEAAGAPLHLLAALCDHSFVRRVSSGRFEIHSLMKQYAAEKLAAQPALQDEVHARYAHYYGEWLDQMYHQLKGPQQLSTLSSLRAEAPDLLGACHLMLQQQDFPRLQRVIMAVILFYEMDDQRVQMQAVIGLLGKLLSILSPLIATRPQTAPGPLPAASYPDLYILTLAALRRFIGRASSQWDESNPLQQESLQIAQQLPDSQAKAFALLLNVIGPGMLSPAQRSEISQQCIAFFETSGDVWATALAKLVAGDNDTFGGADSRMALADYQASLAAFTRLGNAWGRAMCLIGLAEVERRAGHLPQAARLARESLDIFEQMNNQERMLLSRHILADIAEAMGEFEDARSCITANLGYLSQFGDGPYQRYFRQRLEKLADGQSSTFGL